MWLGRKVLTLLILSYSNSSVFSDPEEADIKNRERLYTREIQEIEECILKSIFPGSKYESLKESWMKSKEHDEIIKKILCEDSLDRLFEDESQSSFDEAFKKEVIDISKDLYRSRTGILTIQNKDIDPIWNFLIQNIIPERMKNEYKKHILAEILTGIMLEDLFQILKRYMVNYAFKSKLFDYSTDMTKLFVLTICNYFKESMAHFTTLSNTCPIYNTAFNLLNSYRNVTNDTQSTFPDFKDFILEFSYYISGSKNEYLNAQVKKKIPNIQPKRIGDWAL